MSLSISHTHEAGSLLDGTARGDGSNHVLKRHGWRWSRSDTATVASPITPDAALQILATVSIEAPSSVDYERNDFGSGWIDVDRNGCDTRNDILDRDLTQTTYEPGTHECVVLTGTLDDPYSGAVIDFSRGQDTSSLVQIDHLIPLSWAAQQGANDWDNETRAI